MTLAMDIDDYIEREKGGWFAEGEARGIVKGKAEGRAEVALAMLQANMPVEQISSLTGLTVEQIKGLPQVQ